MDSHSLPSPSEQRTIYWEPEKGFGGFGDRLRGLAGMIVVARASGFDKLVVYSPPNRAMPFMLDSVIEPHPSIAFSATKVAPSTLERGDVIRREPHNLWIDGWMASDGNIHVKRGSFYKAWCAVIQELVERGPKYATLQHWLREQVKDQVHRVRVIGVHVRRSDAVAPSERIPPEKVGALDNSLLSRVIADHHEFPGTTYYMATDTAKYAEEWPVKLRQAGLEVITFPKDFKASAFRQTEGDAIFADLVCLGNCLTIYASCESSMLLVARAIGQTPQVGIIGIQD